MLDSNDRQKELYLYLFPALPRRACEATVGFGKPEGFPTVDFQPLARECADYRLPRAVMYRDSFAASFIPFLSEHFQRILYIWNHESKTWDGFDGDIIERERPDVVIQELAEYKLAIALPSDP
jgi:hypothetical protein